MDMTHKIPINFNLRILCRCYSSKNKYMRDRIVNEIVTPNTKRAQRVYGFGYTSTGALGIKKFILPEGRNPTYSVRKPVRLSFFDENNLKIMNMACGFGFSLFSCRKGSNFSVYGCGLNTDSQLGSHRNAVRNTIGDINVELVLDMEEIRSPAGKSFPEISSLACGRAHTLLVGRTDAHSPANFMWTLGNNAFGQCAREIISGEIFAQSDVINTIKLPEGIAHISQVCCGQDHSLLLTDKGHVYSCGLSSDGQTGLGHFDNVDRWTRVTGAIEREHIVHISSRGDTVLAVCESGRVFGWGNSEYGQLPDCDEMQMNLPIEISFPKEAGRIVECAAAGSACAVRDDKGQVFIWGYGQLGLGPHVNHMESPRMIPAGLFGNNEICPEPVRVNQLSCGLHHFLALTSRGQVFSWGSNRSGCLGQGDYDEGLQTFAMRICLPGEPLKVACGVDHTIILARSFA